MKSREKGFASGILAAIITILVVVGLLYLIETRGGNPSATVPGWKIYTSSDYDYSVEYPPNYTLEDHLTYISIKPDTGDSALIINPSSLSGRSVFDQGYEDLIPGCKPENITLSGRTASACAFENASGFIYHARIIDLFSLKWDPRNEIYFNLSLTQSGMTEDLYHQTLSNYEKILTTLKLSTINT
jgi:hypothetical protein